MEIKAPNQRVVGAFVIGVALVLLSYLASNFGQPYSDPATLTSQTVGSERAAIAITDQNNNGIEDWKETINTTPVIINRSADDYTPPESLTGQFAIKFFENIVRAKHSAGFGASPEEVIEQSVGAAVSETEDTMYTESDVIIIPDSDAALRQYANTVGSILANNNLDSAVAEPTAALRNSLNTQDPQKLEDLKKHAAMYKILRDEYLNTPVPEYFVPVHVAMINVFHALYGDMTAFSKTYDDPLYALLRLKRYQDDVVGLSIALETMFIAVDNSEVIFEIDDPAVYFVLFAPDETN